MGLTSTEGSTEIATALRECCYSCVPALIIVPDRHEVLQARFAELLPDQLSLDLFSEIQEELAPSCRVCVSYPQQGRSCIFLAEVVAHQLREPPLPPQLVTGLPTLISWTESRQTFRVPVVDRSGLVVHVTVGDERIEVEPLDLSFSGVAVEFPAGHAPDLAPESWCEVELQLDQLQVNQRAKVKRRVGRLYGLFFPGTIDGDKIRPPEELRSLVRALERIWLLRVKRFGG